MYIYFSFEIIKDQMVFMIIYLSGMH